MPLATEQKEETEDQGPIDSASAQQRPVDRSAFGRLPVELVNRILELLCDHCIDPSLNQQCRDSDEVRGRVLGLSGLSRATSWLHNLATPFLYHHFPLRVDAGDRNRNGYRLFNFVRTLVQRPHLADHVVILGIDVAPAVVDRWPAPKSLHVLSKTDWMIVRDAAKKYLRLRHEYQHLPALDLGYPETSSHTTRMVHMVCMALALALTKKVELMNVAVVPPGGPTKTGETTHGLFVGVTIKNSLNFNALTNLKRVNVRAPPVTDYKNPFDLYFGSRMPWTLPSTVQTLEVVCLANIPIINSLTLHRNLVRVDLVYTNITKVGLENFLREAKSLKEFTFVFGKGLGSATPDQYTRHLRIVRLPADTLVGPPHARIYDKPVCPECLFRALGHVSKTLKRLVVDFPSRGIVLRHGLGNHGLRHLDHLEELYVGTSLLYKTRDGGGLTGRMKRDWIRNKYYAQVVGQGKYYVPAHTQAAAPQQRLPASIRRIHIFNMGLHGIDVKTTRQTPKLSHPLYCVVDACMYYDLEALLFPKPRLQALHDVSNMSNAAGTNNVQVLTQESYPHLEEVRVHRPPLHRHDRDYVKNWPAYYRYTTVENICQGRSPPGNVRFLVVGPGPSGDVVVDNLMHKLSIVDDLL